MRDRALSRGESGQSGGVIGALRASRGAAWYLEGGGGGVPHPPRICRVRVWRQWRLVIGLQ